MFKIGDVVYRVEKVDRKFTLEGQDYTLRNVLILRKNTIKAIWFVNRLAAAVQIGVGEGNFYEIEEDTFLHSERCLFPTQEEAMEEIQILMGKEQDELSSSATSA